MPPVALGRLTSNNDEGNDINDIFRLLPEVSLIALQSNRSHFYLLFGAKHEQMLMVVLSIVMETGKQAARLCWQHDMRLPAGQQLGNKHSTSVLLFGT